MSRVAVALALGLVVVAPLAAQAQEGFRVEVDEADLAQLGEPEGRALTGEELTERAHAVASLMRCPSCQGLSVADSHTPASAAMRAKVERLLALGYSQEQVLSYFEASFGEFIRLAPRAEGFNLFVWIAPVAILLAGFALVVWRIRSARRARLAAADLEAFRERVRAEVER
ncbi:MAG: cytochrome c-type biogenesis protein [Thermoanaerobaculia bacterium]